VYMGDTLAELEQALAPQAAPARARATPKPNPKAKPRARSGPGLQT